MSGKATMAELCTVLSVEDLHDLIEIAKVEAHNADVIRRFRENK